MKTLTMTENTKPLQATPAEKEVAAKIADIMKEPNRDLVQNVVVVVGTKKATEFLAKAAKMYKAGVKTEDGSRARTVGGCFFYVCKGKMKPTDRRRAGLLTQRERKAKTEEQT